MRNFEIMGEIVKRLGKPFTDQYPQITWREMAAFRDVIIHDYETINVDTVWKIVEDDLPTLRTNVVDLLTSLSANDEE